MADQVATSEATTRASPSFMHSALLYSETAVEPDYTTLRSLHLLAPSNFHHHLHQRSLSSPWPSLSPPRHPTIETQLSFETTTSFLLRTSVFAIQQDDHLIPLVQHHTTTARFPQKSDFTSARRPSRLVRNQKPERQHSPSIHRRCSISTVGSVSSQTQLFPLLLSHLGSVTTDKLKSRICSAGVSTL